jgi:predicted double-glycine peptidase
LQPRWVFLVEFGVVLFVSAAFLGLGYVLSKRHRWARFASIIIGTACMSYRILNSTFPHHFYIPSPYLLLSGVITPAGFLLLAAALASPKQGARQRVIMGVFAVILTYYVFCDVAYLAVRGPEVARLAGRWEQETMRQSRRFTCGPAAGAALLQAWGLRVREGELAFAARTSFRGTELSRLADAIRHFGRYEPLTVEIRLVTFDDLRELNRPAVLMVEKGRLRHVVTLLKLDGGTLKVADPSNGTRVLTVAQFDKDYEWDGRVILAWRNPDFASFSHDPPEPSLHP